MIHRLWQRTNFTRAGIALCASAALMGCSEQPAAPVPAAEAVLLPAAEAELTPVTVTPALRYPAEALAAHGNLRMVSLEFPAPPIPPDAAETTDSRPRVSFAPFHAQPVPPPDEAIAAQPTRLPPASIANEARVEAEQIVRTPPVEEYAELYDDATAVGAAPATDASSSDRPRSRWSDVETESSHDQSPAEPMEGWTFQPQPIETPPTVAEPACEAPTLSMPIFEPSPVDRRESFDEERSFAVDNTVRRLPFVVDQPVSAVVEETFVDCAECSCSACGCEAASGGYCLQSRGRRGRRAGRRNARCQRTDRSDHSSRLRPGPSRRWLFSPGGVGGVAANDLAGAGHAVRRPAA